MSSSLLHQIHTELAVQNIEISWWWFCSDLFKINSALTMDQLRIKNASQ